MGKVNVAVVPHNPGGVPVGGGGGSSANLTLPGGVLQANMITTMGTLTSNAILVTNDLFIADKLALGVLRSATLLEPPERLYVADGNLRLVRGNVDVLTGNINVRSGNIFGVRFGDVVGRPMSTDDLAEGSLALYHTPARVREALAAGGPGLCYDESTGTFRANAASIYEQGVVRLSDSLADPSVTKAATANAVKAAFDTASTKLDRAGDTMTGPLCVTAAGAGAGAAATVRVSAQGGSDAFVALEGGAALGGGWSIGIPGGSAELAIRQSNSFAAGACVPLVIDVGGNVGLAGCVAPSCQVDTGPTAAVRFGPFVANSSGLLYRPAGAAAEELYIGPFRVTAQGVFVAGTGAEVMLRTGEMVEAGAGVYAAAAAVW